MAELALSPAAVTGAHAFTALPPDRSEERAALRLAGPAGLLMLALLVAPTIAIFVLSMTDAELGVPDWHFIGVAAYADLLSDPRFLRSISNTAIYVAIVTPVSVAFGLGLALLIEADVPFRSAFRSLYFLPVVSLTVAMATVWQYLMHPISGPLNLLLGFIGVPAVNWLGSSDTVLLAMAMIGIWQAVGFNMVLFLAGLTAINRELYAAAEIDGAKTAWSRFRLVTWPMLGPTTLFVVTITIVNALKVFDTVATLTQGGPAKGSEVLLWTIYQEGFVYLRTGPASAMAVVFIAVLLVLLVIQTRVLDRRVHY
jgi:multiple sugar transport system permease protein